MKRTTLLILSILLSQYLIAQIETKCFPDGDAHNKVSFIKQFPETDAIYRLPTFDVQKLIIEESIYKDFTDIPFRFGKGFDVNITLFEGKWINLNEGRLWMMSFQSDGAFSMNFVFDNFYLSQNAQLFVINNKGTVLYGPVTSQHTTKSGFFLTDLIPGDIVTIYLFEPNDEMGESSLTIRRVIHGYKNLFPSSFGDLGGSQLSCHNNIICFPDWDQESDAVALVMLSNGEELCSGSLLITTDFSFRPYLLSAFHCIDTEWNPQPNGVLSVNEIAQAENWLFKFQFKMNSCLGNTATTSYTYNGAHFRAAWQPTDFALMEMEDSPFGNDIYTWLG